MLISLLVLACASKSVLVEDEAAEPTLDAKTGVMVAEVAQTARPATVRLPDGAPVVRECFSGSRGRYGGSKKSYSAPTRPSSGPAPSSTATAPAPVAPTMTPKVAPMPAAEPAPPPVGGSAIAQGGGGTLGAGSSSGYARDQAESLGYLAASADADDESANRQPAKAKAAEGRTAANKPADAKPASATTTARAEESELKADAPAELAKKRPNASNLDPSTGDRGMVAEKDHQPRADKESQRLAREEANFDWGGVTYLSNDDSMSLASAQRLLWAIQNRGPVKTSEVRPHELLNYFSFDTAPVAAGDTFSVMAAAEQTAPDTLTLAMAVKGVTPPRQPVDLTLVLDRSGSMEAEGRMEYLKRGLTKMTGELERGDRVDLVLFDDSVCTPLENYVVGRDDPALLTEVIDSLAPRGSTDLDAGLREGYRVAKSHTDTADRNRRVLLISDALLNTGEVDADVVSEVGKSYESANIRLSAVGVGRDFNDDVLDMLTEKGKGAYVYLGSEAVVDRVFGQGFDSLVQTVAHDVHFSIDLPPSLAMQKFYGEESSTVKSEVQPIHYYAGTTQLFMQDLRIRDSRAVRSDTVRLNVEWTDPASGEAREQSFTSSVGQLMDADPRNLHKGRALLAWTDMILARSMGGDPCGAPYSTWAERVETLGEDAEVAWLDGLTAPLCSQRPVSTKQVARAGVPYKVKVDADQVIAEVGMRCGSARSTESLVAGSNVARFEVRPGSCELVLYGNVPMVASVEVPAQGGDVRCMVRGGRLNCS